MEENKSYYTKAQLLHRLIALAQQLPKEQIEQVSRFAEDLQAGDVSPQFARGFADALLDALDQVGPLKFEENELDTLLSELEQLRDLDIEEND